MVKHEEVGTRTRDGRCPVHVFTPDGASHGWMKPDFPVYDEASTERGRSEISALFNRARNGEGRTSVRLVTRTR